MDAKPDWLVELAVNKAGYTVDEISYMTTKQLIKELEDKGLIRKVGKEKQKKFK